MELTMRVELVDEGLQRVVNGTGPAFRGFVTIGTVTCGRCGVVGHFKCIVGEKLLALAPDAVAFRKSEESIFIRTAEAEHLAVCPKAKG